MTAHMSLKKPRRGTATAMRRARSRLAQTRFLASCVLVRERDGERCRVYGTTGWIEVHHIIPRARGGGHDPENLVCLSKRAHDEVHAGKLWLTGPASALVVSYEKPGRAA